MKRLSELGIGKKAKILSFEKDEIFIKLMEMGCLPGELIRVVKIAPLGDPMAIIVSGYELSLRKEEASCVWVHENPNPELVRLN